MLPRHGEVWLADLGLAGKIRPVVVLLADDLEAPRTLIIHVPVTRQSRGSALETDLRIGGVF
jgi:mRNA interferase MazF